MVRNLGISLSYNTKEKSTKYTFNNYLIPRFYQYGKAYYKLLSNSLQIS